MSRYRLSDRAKQELRSITEYIENDNPHAATVWAAKVRERIRLVARMPHSGRVVPELGRAELREVVVGNYRVVYRVVPKEIRVVSIFEGHLLLGPLDPDE